MIGSSILIIFDDNNECGAWLIDFTKTMLMTDKTLTHRDPWVLGNHEDGYLFGVDNLIQVRPVWFKHTFHNYTTLLYQYYLFGVDNLIQVRSVWFKRTFHDCTVTLLYQWYLFGVDNLIQVRSVWFKHTFHDYTVTLLY